MANTTIDHNQIRKWAERHGGKPAAVKRTHEGGDVGIIRIMFPKAPNSEHGALDEISWDEFFEQFEDNSLALLYEEDSMFSKIIGRDTVDRREHGDNHASRHEGRDDGGRDHGGRKTSHASDHGKDGSGTGAKRASSEESRREASDLKSREYTDSKGEVHHHTRSYMERHEGDRSKH